MKIPFLFLYLLATTFVSSTIAQTVTGEWYGVGKVKKAGDHNSYLSEMVLKQKGNKVTGELNYFYRSSEIKIKVSGKYDSRYRVLELTPQPMLNFLAMNSNGADCPMEGSFTLKTVDGQKVLAGQFNPTYEYRTTCPAIDVKFTKYNPKTSKVLPDVEEDTIEAKSTKPLANKVDTIKKAVTTKTSTPVNRRDTANRPSVINKFDTVKTTAVIARQPIIHKPITEEQQVSQALKLRAFDASPTIEVDADSLKVSLYDNGEVDNDTISLFYNRKLVARGLMLSDKPLTFTLPLDNSTNEIAMFAENLGKIPPNTALAIIYAGGQRFELNLTSTLDKNAAIRFKRKLKRIDPKNIN